MKSTWRRGLAHGWLGQKGTISEEKQILKVRTLAIKLFEAGQAAKRKQPRDIWGNLSVWDDLPSESVAVWDAIAICAIHSLKQTNPTKEP